MHEVACASHTTQMLGGFWVLDMAGFSLSQFNAKSLCAAEEPTGQHAQEPEGRSLGGQCREAMSRSSVRPRGPIGLLSTHLRVVPSRTESGRDDSSTSMSASSNTERLQSGLPCFLKQWP